MSAFGLCAGAPPVRSGCAWMGVNNRGMVGPRNYIAPRLLFKHTGRWASKSWAAHGSAQTLSLSKLKWDAQGLIPAIVQHVDTGEVLMQAYSDADSLVETLETGLATFYSRSRKGRWCKGETSGNFIKVLSVHLDCDHDSLLYLGKPIGPACHTNAPTCYFERVALAEVSEDCPIELELKGDHTTRAGSPMPSLRALETIIEDRWAAAQQPGAKPSWTVKLLNNPDLLCSKILEEAGELCQTWEKKEGHERTVSEAADLLYHALVLLNHEGVSLEEVGAELRRRFAMSGLEEKASRPPKQPTVAS